MAGGHFPPGARIVAFIHTHPWTKDDHEQRPSTPWTGSVDENDTADIGRLLGRSFPNGIHIDPNMLVYINTDTAATRGTNHTYGYDRRTMSVEKDGDIIQ